MTSILIDDVGDGAEGALTRSADGTKLTGAGDTPEGAAADPRDPASLEKWGSKSLLQFYNASCSSLASL